MIYVVTNLDNAESLARKMRRWSQDRYGYAQSVARRGNSIIVKKDKKPWSELAGHMTNDTQIYTATNMEKALELA